MLHTRAVVFALEKAGSTEGEWEDGAATDSGDLRRGRNPRFALADGATEAYDSIRWVAQLLDSFMGSADAAGPALDKESMLRWFEASQHTWTSAPPRFANFFEERKFAEGSFATLLGCEIRRVGPDRLAWDAVALGDTVLFHVRNRQLIEHFPRIGVDDFGLNPAGVHTHADALAGMMAELQITTGVHHLQPGDQMFFATDALAAWIISALRRDGQERVWRFFAGISHPNAFARFVADRRTEHSLKNDDVTLIRVDVADTAPSHVLVCCQ
jgi:hypothetical protein